MLGIGADDQLAKQLVCRWRIETVINPIRIDWARRGVGVPLQGPRASGHGGLPSLVTRMKPYFSTISAFWVCGWVIPKHFVRTRPGILRIQPAQTDPGMARADDTGLSRTVTTEQRCMVTLLRSCVP
jgi:hypothetical protein